MAVIVQERTENLGERIREPLRSQQGPKPGVSSAMDAFEALHHAIQTRPRPEDVAQLIIDIFDERDEKLSRREREILEGAARYSLKRSVSAYTSMSRDFARVIGAERQVTRAAKIFEVEPLNARACLDVTMVDAFLNQLASMIGVDPIKTDFKEHRKNRAERKASGIGVKKRRYNKMFRNIRRLRWKIDRMIGGSKKYEATRLAKSAGAIFIGLEDLQQDLNTACFVAYLSARMSLRSAFTNTSQERAFDTIADMLYRRAAKYSPNWWAIAMVHPEKKVIKHLTDEQKGRLVGLWVEKLGMLAGMLRELDRTNSYDLHNCIVHRGNDSTTWNAVAGAWNKARDHWFALLLDLEMEFVLEHYCPGKVLRLMASDVVQWQVMSKVGYNYNVKFDWGNQELIDRGLHPDTLVWRELPRPWDVFDRKVECPKSAVVAACKKHGVKVDGWVGPKPPKRAVEFHPTPELVHGVAVASPYLADVLKKASWFSGKPISQPRGALLQVGVRRDEHGAALLVTGELQGTEISPV